ncbi:MAG: hypothetical protein Q4C63_02640 [Eubacteriales bacterium]|nr:hypothetical protein [Eubacteriales bacterium]
MKELIIQEIKSYGEGTIVFDNLIHGGLSGDIMHNDFSKENSADTYYLAGSFERMLE